MCQQSRGRHLFDKLFYTYPYTVYLMKHVCEFWYILYKHDCESKISIFIALDTPQI